MGGGPKIVCQLMGKKRPEIHSAQAKDVDLYCNTAKTCVNGSAEKWVNPHRTKPFLLPEILSADLSADRTPFMSAVRLTRHSAVRGTALWRGAD